MTFEEKVWWLDKLILELSEAKSALTRPFARLQGFGGTHVGGGQVERIPAGRHRFLVAILKRQP